MSMFSDLAQLMQGFFCRITEEGAALHPLIRRERKFNAFTLLRTWVLGFLRYPQPTSEELAGVAAELGVDVCDSAIEQRVTVALEHALKDLLKRAVEQMVQVQPRLAPLPNKFSAVLVGDSTVVELTDSLAKVFPGCGGNEATSKAALKIQVPIDLLNGPIRQAAIEAGKQSDNTSPAARESRPANSLSLYDLGYFDLERFAALAGAGAYWISRSVWQVKVVTESDSSSLLDFLKSCNPASGVIDAWIELGQTQRLRCRLIAWRAPQEGVAQRRRKAYAKAAKKGRQPTKEHLEMWEWTVFLTNASEEQLSWKEVIVLYRLRWQVELLFKLWKSHNRIDEHRSSDPVRQMVEFYARLIGALVQHWLLLVTGWGDLEKSMVKAAKVLRTQLTLIIAALGDRERLAAAWERIAKILETKARIARRHDNPSAAQLLTDPEPLNYVP